MNTRKRESFNEIVNIDSTKLIDEIQSRGVARLNSVLTSEQVDVLRNYILTELGTAAYAVTVEGADRTALFGNVKMTYSARWDLKHEFKSPMIETLHSLLGSSILGETLLGLTEEDGGGEFYELSSFITKSGAKRQVVHSDTLWTASPVLYTVTVALQDTFDAMGPTVFLPDSMSEEVYIKRVYDRT